MTEDDIYSDPELVEDFLQNVLWPILDFGPNSVAFLTNRSDLTDFFGPGMQNGVQNFPGSWGKER